MDASEIRSRVHEYLVENFLFGGEGAEIGDDDSFLESGLIDSTGILELIQFLEETFDMVVDDEDMIPENLDSIQRVTKYVGSKLQG
jgi:acyl carrier protein